MERRDYQKSGGYHYGSHDEGYQRTDESTVELAGNITEAEVIVDALKVYIALEDILRTMGVDFVLSKGGKKGRLEERPTVYARDLLSQIAEPNFVEGPQAKAS